MVEKKNTEATTKTETKDEKKEVTPKNLAAKVNDDSDLSEEDKQLKDELNLCIQKLQEANASLYKSALEILRKRIKESTSSMTSVPKPLKFLRAHYETIKQCYEKIVDPETKAFCADIISVLGMTISDTRECLKYRFLSSKEDIGSWGFEYVRHLTTELAAELNETEEEGAVSLNIPKDGLYLLAEDIINFYMKHNAEAEACDLLMEIEKLDYLEKYIEKETYQRVCLYLLGCVPYVPEPEDSILLKTCYKIYRKFEQEPLALRCAIQLNDMDLIQEVFYECKDELVRKQLAFILGRQQIYWEIDESRVEDSETLKEIMSNSKLSQNFHNLARELDIMEAKQPEDVYKSHLENRSYTTTVDSAKQNLAASFVNGFLNAGFGKDKLLTDEKEANTWIHRNKDQGIMSTTATLGFISLWDVESGLPQIDKYLYSEDYVKAGALLACGVVNSGIQNECDPALALLGDYVTHKSNTIRIGAILGLGLAYAGKNRSDVINLISGALGDSNANMEVVGVAALSLGLIAVGTGNGEVTSTLMQTLLEKSETDLKDTFSKYIALAIGLIYLGKGEMVDVILESLKVVAEPLQSFAAILVEVCAYAGSGNVLKVQHLLHICGESSEANNAEAGKDADPKKKEETKDTKDSKDSKKDAKEKKDDTHWTNLHQAVAVIGISLISMNEEIGAEMVLRTFGHLLHYGEPVIKKAVPLGLALLSVSNPKLNILDTLSKFSHDADAEVSYNSIFAMGIVGAGTNNARLAAMLRQLALYHAKDQNNLFMVRLAQGLTHLGKGTLTLSPYHSHRALLCRVSLAGLLAVIIGFLDVKNIILTKSHYMLFNLALAMQPRMLITFDENLQPLPVTVRVGQAVDVVGQAGKPKTITGFQTHTTPVLLAHGERAELATDEYISLTPVLEGFVILRKNPAHMELH